MHLVTCQYCEQLYKIKVNAIKLVPELRRGAEFPVWVPVCVTHFGYWDESVRPEKILPAFSV